MNPEDRNQKLAAFIRNSPYPLLEFSADGALAYYNDAAKKLAGGLGETEISTILPEETRGIVLECLRSGYSKTNLQTLHQKRTLSWSFIPISESNTVHGYVNDVTERLSLEEQLRHSVKMEAVGQLAAGVAHDFNNILTIIQGHADLLLQSETLLPSNEKSVRNISAAAQRAGKLIKQLLMFSRKQVMQPRYLSLNQVVSNVLPMLQGLLGDDIALQFDPGEDLPPLYVDVGMIEQVLINLVINARDAMPNGGQLALATSRKILEPVAVVFNPEARAGRFVCLSVADTGTGMDAATLAHIFEPFFTTKEVGKGTGLGLATVYGIMKQHNGWITAESQVSGGSTFTLFLPEPTADTAVLAQSTAETSTAIHQSMPKGTETILLAEDEPILRELVANILQFCGYRIFAGETGAAAVKLWHQHKDEIKLLLTDMVMPGGMSGRQLAEQLQKEDPKLKVVYTSGYSPGMAGKDIALLEGFNFLAKPYPPGKLAQVVRDALDGKPAKK